MSYTITTSGNFFLRVLYNNNTVDQHAIPMENPYGEPLWRTPMENPYGEPLLRL